MRFLPHSPGDVRAMLDSIGAESVEDLFPSVPASLRKTAAINLPPGEGEREVAGVLGELASRNRIMASFQGAGAYDHFVPAAVSQIMSRSEFATAYTPYQPEVSQGTLQACFEFQTYVSMLTGLEVANASMYDGASAFAEALLMALRIGRKRSKLLISAGLHPEYRQVAATYLDGFGRGELIEVPLGPDGRTDLAALDAALDSDVAAVCVGYPNFFGVIEDVSAVARLAKREDALAITATAESLALALLRSPGECGADIAIAEGQSFGLPVSYGGPGVGLFAARRSHVRNMPGRLVGETVDEQGRRGYVLTLATREQHIRRDKATSNICTNQGLTALCATVYLGLAGRRGLRELAVENTRRAHQVAERLQAETGMTPIYSGPFFNEFVVKVPDCEAWFDSAVAAGVVPGVKLGPLFESKPEFRDALLVAVTECNTDAQIDRLVQRAGQKAAA